MESNRFRQGSDGCSPACTADPRFYSQAGACGMYRGADKSLARPTAQCIFFYGYNILFVASLVINSTNIPPILIINRIYETQNLLSL